MADYINEMLDYISKATTAYQAVDEQKRLLDTAGFIKLCENEDYNIVPGGSYYVSRGSSALIAFRVPRNTPVRIAAALSHSDSPTFKIKNNPEINVEDSYVKLNVEPYGSAIYSSWFDRPLSVAGRLYVRSEDCSEYSEIMVDAGEDICMIPSLAIHFDRNINKGREIDAQKELLPVISLNKTSNILERLCGKVNIKSENVVSHDLFLYNREKSVRWGCESEFVSSPRLDDNACGFASLKSLIDSSVGNDLLKVHVVFNNEEVGSSSRCGACSGFFSDTLERIAAGLGMYGTQYQKMIASSFMLSADNAHALHPNYPEKSDITSHVYPGKGIALKFAGNQKYTTDAESAAYVHKLADMAGIRLQNFHNNSNIAGGSTLGNLLVRSTPILCADVGIPQLAMHSSYETCAVSDAEDMYKLINKLYEG